MAWIFLPRRHEGHEEENAAASNPHNAPALTYTLQDGSSSPGPSLDLSPHAQLLRRRELLDHYGFVAQVSVLVPVLVVVAYVWTRKFFPLRAGERVGGGGGGGGGEAGRRSSPYAKAAARGCRGVRDLEARWRRLGWWLGADVEVRGVGRMGTRGEVLGGVAWLGWLLVLSLVETGNDYLHITKRFGIVGASQLPFHYLLSVKSPYSPLQLLTATSSASLISIHNILGKIITVLFWCHSALYVNFYVINGFLTARLKEFYVLCGIFAIIGFSAVGTTALKPVRDWSYRVFYITHVSLATILLPALYFHVDHIRPYVYETVAVYGASVLLRFISTRTQDAAIKRVSENLVEVTVPLTKGAARWQPGQHAYVSLHGHALLRTFRSNPFTVASIPPIDGQLKIVARILDGNTAKLVRNFPGSKVCIEGPYGLGTHSGALLGYDRVLFVAGGVGATFIVPLYRQLLSDLSPSKGSHRRQKVGFLWIARSMGDVAWALPADNDAEREGFVERLTVHLTRDHEGHAEASADGFAIGGDDEDEDKPGQDGIELEERKNLLAEGGDEKGSGGTDAAKGLSLRVGRPDLARAVQDVFAQSSTERVAVMVCGPRGLSRSLRKEVGRWVKRGRDVWFWEEVFGL